LNRSGRKVSLSQWAGELLDSMQGLAELLDYGNPQRPYFAALEAQRAKVDDVERTPSARLLAEMRQTGETFFELAQRMSKLHKDYFLGLYPPNERRLAEFAAAAQDSHDAQARIEAADTLDFDTYLARYLKD
jgi:glutamate--cysteine ligase